jgi:hypothetical protein
MGVANTFLVTYPPRFSILPAFFEPLSLTFPVSDNAAVLWPHYPKEKLKMILAIDKYLTWRASLVLIDTNGDFQCLIDSSYDTHYLTPDAATIGLLQRSAAEIQKAWETKASQAGSSSERETPAASR